MHRRFNLFKIQFDGLMRIIMNMLRIPRQGDHRFYTMVATSYPEHVSLVQFFRALDSTRDNLENQHLHQYLQEVQMPQERLSMRKITEALRLKHENDLSNRKIAASCKIGKPTMANYLSRAQQAEISWPLPLGMTEDQL